MKDEKIILIGPVAVGKTILARLLGKKLGLQYLSLYKLRIEYENNDVPDFMLELSGLSKRSDSKKDPSSWEEFFVSVIERSVTNFQNVIIDTETENIYVDGKLFVRVQTALSPYPNVFLILPSPDLEISLHILDERAFFRYDETEKVERIVKYNAHLLQHPANYLLAKFVVFTEGKTPEETCEEIIEKIGKPSPFAY